MIDRKDSVVRELNDLYRELADSLEFRRLWAHLPLELVNRIEQMAEVDKVDAISTVRTWLADPDPTRVHTAILVLMKLRDKESLAAMRKLLARLSTEPPPDQRPPSWVVENAIRVIEQR